eukprot:TRINITY_DN64814_c0_g1_i1.p1 TRINITY_DN64814_c0_g1~~TRINITY_DN64814_c0_g1_i1.p1  ORF type:complete len:517 (-),score=10.30 TRINITY_DN64814_c0_g1_i1:59-1609(-)
MYYTAQSESTIIHNYQVNKQIVTMRYVHKTLSCLLVLFAFSAAVPSFFSFYDLARKDTGTMAYDLMGRGPIMEGGQKIEHGVYLPSHGKSWVNLYGNTLRISHEGYNTGTILSAFKSEHCEKGYFYSWALIQKAPEYPRCGIACNSNTTGHTWSFVCLYSGGDREESKTFTTPSGDVTVLGISFFPENEMVGMTVFWQTKYGGVRTRSYTSTLMKYEEFFPNAKLAYRGIQGNLYYVGFLTEAIDSETFSRFSGTVDPDTKSIKCTNCLGAASELRCPSTKLNTVPFTTREYFCSCASGEGYDLSLDKCVPATRDCYLPCERGCKSSYPTHCLYECPYPFIKVSILGDFVSCQCPGGGLQKYGSQWCFPESPKDDPPNILLTIVLPVLLSAAIGILIIVVVCCKCRGGSAQTQAEDKTEPKELDLKIEDLRLGTECKVCYRPGAKLVALVPCGHASVCEDCVKKITLCPFDRSRIKKWIPVDKIVTKTRNAEVKEGSSVVVAINQQQMIILLYILL